MSIDAPARLRNLFHVNTMTFSIGILSYSVAALAYLFLSVLLATSWRGRFQGALLAVASATTFVWALILSLSQLPSFDFPLLVDALEILHSGLWIAFLLKLLAMPERNQVISRQSEKVLFILLGLACLAIALPAMLTSQPSVVIWSRIIGPLTLAISGMVLVEQLFRSTRVEHRWGIKFICLGIGGMFVYDFYLYADALLFKRIDTELWQARGIVNALIMPLIAVSAARNPQWSLDVFISRRAVFHTTAILAAGLYLLSMAAAGYYIRVFGGSWGRVIQVVFLFGAVVMLMVLMFSGTLRARLKVFLSKHFFNYRYDYREEWLNFTQTLSEGEPGIRIRERSIQAIARLVESPGGALWVTHEHQGYTRIAHWNMPQAGGIQPRSGELEVFLKEREWVVNLNEYEVNPELYGNLQLPAWLTTMPNAWLVVPLMVHQHLLGFVILARSLGGSTAINWEVSDLLKTAGRQAASFLAQVEAAEQLMIARQFESFNRVSAFIVHDLKNMVAQLSLLLSNAEKHKSNPEFQDDMLSTIENSVAKMRKLLSQMHSSKSPEAPQPIELARLLSGVVQRFAQHAPSPKFTSQCPGFIVLVDAERLEKIIAHLLQNAIEATSGDGNIEMRLRCDNKGATIEIEDDGCGMDEQFIRERLFRPFATTKSSGMGIGAYEAREAIVELGGGIDVTSQSGKGTTFTIWLPKTDIGREALAENIV